MSDIDGRLASIVRRVMDSQARLDVQAVEAWSTKKSKLPDTPPLFPRSPLDPPNTSEEQQALLVAFHDAVCRVEGCLERQFLRYETSRGVGDDELYRRVKERLPFEAAVVNIHGRIVHGKLDEADLNLLERAICEMEKHGRGHDIKANLVHEGAALPEALPALPGTSSTNDDSHLGPAKLAELFGVKADALRTRLNRWRRKNKAGWIENADRTSKEPMYLYRLGAVRHIVDKMKATSKTTSKRPA